MAGCMSDPTFNRHPPFYPNPRFDFHADPTGSRFHKKGFSRGSVKQAAFSAPLILGIVTARPPATRRAPFRGAFIIRRSFDDRSGPMHRSRHLRSQFLFRRATHRAQNRFISVEMLFALSLTYSDGLLAESLAGLGSTAANSALSQSVSLEADFPK